ncbi:O-acyltransferase like protein-like isoform X3 [Ooceraea biroi]|uniref:O-acyltransferase like protein-like isoform X3 n=1 Tax=Ooceraea biroi TaxID=2015173 RepID=UPI0005BA4799|nr:O-acyltransferase like protein-like isoform X3 [Ooceraea biroi]
MEVMRWTARAVLVLVLTTVAKVGTTRPEDVLANVFTRPFVPRTNASFECIRDGEIYLQALSNYTPWALQMYDSSVKIPSGLITGNHRTLGNFDECVQVTNNEHGFIGQACNVGVRFNITPDNDTSRELDLGDLFRNVAIASGATNWTSGVTIIYEWIWCVPSTCNYSEIGKATEVLLEPLIIPERVNLTVYIDQKSCQTRKSDKTWQIADFCYTIAIVMFAFIVIASTGYHIWLNRQIKSQCDNMSHEMAEQWKKAVLTSFSLYKNGKDLLRTDRPQGYLNCLDGLRFLTTCWIIYGHTHYMEAISVKLNLADIPRMHHDWINMFVLNANISTDIFFLLSGVVLAYNELLKKERVSNWHFISQLYFRRYLRLTPAYAMMIGFYATLFYKFGTGPHWDLIAGTNRDFCRENWWLNLLYVHNYFKLDRMIYSTVYCRFGTYVIGLGLGYILYKTHVDKVKMRMWIVVCGWLIAITIGLTALLGSRSFYFDDHDYNKVEASFYAGLHRQVFALSISWIIFCCMHDYAGPVNRFLSWPGWVPFSKLTYCAYLSHYLFLIANIGSVRTADVLTRMNVVRNFFAVLIFTLAVSVVWYLCFEKPFLIIEKVIFGLSKRNPPQNQNYNQNSCIETGNDETCARSNESATICSNRNNLEESTKDDEKKYETVMQDSKIEMCNDDIEMTQNDDTLTKKTRSNGEKSGYVNVYFYRSFDEHKQSDTMSSVAVFGSSDS